MSEALKRIGQRRPDAGQLPARLVAIQWVDMREVCALPWDCGHVTHRLARLVAETKCAVCGELMGWAEERVRLVGSHQGAPIPCHERCSDALEQMRTNYQR